MFLSDSKIKIMWVFEELLFFKFYNKLQFKMDNILYIYTSYYSFVFKIELSNN
jgi:hypothetical protein